MDETQGSEQPPNADVPDTASPDVPDTASPDVPDIASPASGPSRRTVLAGGVAALLVGGGVGVGAGFVRDSGSGSTGERPRLPAALRDAVADERTLLASARKLASGDTSQVAPLIVGNHEAHLAALLAAADQYVSASPGASATPSKRSGAPVDRSAQRSDERRAALQAARRAEQLTGAPAALLASIAACEATHGVLLESA